MEQAKGPFAPMYYMMVHDIDGRERLAVAENKAGKKYIPGAYWNNAWTAQCDQAIQEYHLDKAQAKQAKKLLGQYQKSLRGYLDENREDILGYLNSLDRFEQMKDEGGNNAPYYKKRVWDTRQQLRGELKGWTTELDAMGDEYRAGLYDMLSNEQKVTYEPLDEGLTQEGFFNFVMTVALTLIGLGLMIGCCTRLANLAGAVFLLNVLLTQPPWPLIYPPMPPVTGHSLIVDKNFVEMIAMLALACIPVGRWAGLDYFLHRWFGYRVMQFVGGPMDPED